MTTTIHPVEIEQSWARVSQFGDAFTKRFYTKLFLAHPDLRDKFPVSMANQRDKLHDMLDTLIDHLEGLHAVQHELEELGRRHLSAYGVKPEHFPMVGGALLATLKHFEGDHWSDDLEEQWAYLYGLAAQTMIESEHV